MSKRLTRDDLPAADRREYDKLVEDATNVVAMPRLMYLGMRCSNARALGISARTYHEDIERRYQARLKFKPGTLYRWRRYYERVWLFITAAQRKLVTPTLCDVVVCSGAYNADKETVRALFDHAVATGGSDATFYAHLKAMRAARNLLDEYGPAALVRVQNVRTLFRAHQDAALLQQLVKNELRRRFPTQTMQRASKASDAPVRRRRVA